MNTTEPTDVRLPCVSPVMGHNGIMEQPMVGVPGRVQRLRCRGWRAPEGAVYVGRPSRWGNPFRIIKHGDSFEVDTSERVHGSFPNHVTAATQAVEWFRWQLEHDVVDVLGFTVDDVRVALAGRDLMCWCPLSSPCHGDVLLEIGNGTGP